MKIMDIRVRGCPVMENVSVGVSIRKKSVPGLELLEGRL